jgi:hypothetical protein
VRAAANRHFDSRSVGRLFPYGVVRALSHALPVLGEAARRERKRDGCRARASRRSSASSSSRLERTRFELRVCDLQAHWTLARRGGLVRRAGKKRAGGPAGVSETSVPRPRRTHVVARRVGGEPELSVARRISACRKAQGSLERVRRLPRAL